MSVPTLRQRRARVLGSNLSLSYASPLEIVRGQGQYLYDRDGEQYLDCVNNVCHVGHSEPRVVRAAAKQMAELNTNTRYLHPYVIEYAERLGATLPAPLEVCYFVNSGSEANELALRLARAYSGGTHVIAHEHAYHGHTQALIDVSHYKFAGAGGAGAPPTTTVVPLPDPYRGQHRGYSAEAGRAYAAGVAAACADLARGGRRLSAFLAESISGCGGQVVYPDGYLAAAFAGVREAGGVCIADEVQVGFGRVGEAMWAFELQGVTPDIVTLGKPIGNGHPLGAVVTTAAVAAAFDNGMEYFNTFGGNPVSCAVGMAVLDVIEDDGLQDHARVVGAELAAGLRGLMAEHEAIGDVRGAGLFLGVEFVKDRGTLEPDPVTARWLVEELRAERVLLSTDGPYDNVIKIKPPLPFSSADASRVVEAMGRGLARRGS